MIIEHQKVTSGETMTTNDVLEKIQFMLASGWNIDAVWMIRPVVEEDSPT